MSQSHLPILMYHGIHDSDASPGRFDPVYSVSTKNFVAQLDWLAANGWKTLLLDEAFHSASRQKHPRSVIITFDDGDVSNAQVAMPLLQARNMSAEFFITSDFIDTDGMLSTEQLRQLKRGGMGIGSHGVTHRFLEDLPIDELIKELQQSKEILEKIILAPVNAIALPGGRGALREYQQALKAGFRHLLGSVPGPNRDLYRRAWLERVAVTSHTTIDQFAALVQWSGLKPRLARARFQALAVPKRVLGNTLYEKVRARFL